MVAGRGHGGDMASMRRLAALLSCILLLPAAAPADLCGPAIAAAERARGTAPGLLAAIGLVESGRTDPRSGLRRPWPWTVTAGGVGTFYASKAEAIAAVRGLQEKGIASVDVGCLQVNLMYHPAAFRDLDQAFDPAANALYAGRFLSGLFARFNDWSAAAAAYHSLLPDRGAQYGRLVAAVWAGAPVPSRSLPGGAQVVTFPDGGQMRILRDATGAEGTAGLVPGRVLGYLSGP